MFLIDGNNLIGQRVGWHRDKAGARCRLIEELSHFIRVRKARVTVVFDGAPDDRFPDGSSYRGAKVFYARPGSDADTRILEMVEAERNRKNLTVVTSDRKLADRVRATGVKVMRSGELRRIIDELANANTGQIMPDIKDDEVEEWLRYFGLSEDGDEMERENAKQTK